MLKSIIWWFITMLLVASAMACIAAAASDVFSWQAAIIIGFVAMANLIAFNTVHPYTDEVNGAFGGR